MLTLAICAQWFGHVGARIRAIRVRTLAVVLSKLITQSSINRRCRDLAGVMSRMVETVAERMGIIHRALPGARHRAVPLMRRCRGERHRLFGHEASIGRGGSDRTGTTAAS